MQPGVRGLFINSMRPLNRVWWGAAALPQSVDGAFVTSLQFYRRSSAKVPSFTVNVGPGQYAWYALPAAMGPCSFEYGGLSGGFSFLYTAVLSNAQGRTRTFTVYRSDYPNLGHLEVKVT